MLNFSTIIELHEKKRKVIFWISCIDAEKIKKYTQKLDDLQQAYQTLQAELQWAEEDIGLLYKKGEKIWFIGVKLNLLYFIFILIMEESLKLLCSKNFPNDLVTDF